MFLLVIIGAFLCVSVDSYAETLVFHMCCQKDEGLVKILDLEHGDSVRYECWGRETIEADDNNSKAKLVVGESVPVVYGELERRPCVREKLSVDVVSLTTTGERCYGSLLSEVDNGTITAITPEIVALSCANKTDDVMPETKVPLHNIRKCCPNGQSYDTVYHICKKSEDSLNDELLLNRLNTTRSNIYEMETGLNCKHSQYGVELSEEFYSLEFDGSGLRVDKKDGQGGGRAFQGEWCMEKDYLRPGLVARVCTPDCASYGAFCVRKCCPVGQHFRHIRCGSPVSVCVSEDISFNISTYMDPLKYYGIGDIIGIRSGLRCPHGKIVLNRSLAQDHHELDHNGALHSPFAADDDYCLESFDSRHCPNGDVHVTAAICFVKAPEIKNFKISFWLISISSVCLALTLVVYCSLPELRNLHGRTLICHVSMMLLAFSCLARVQYSFVSDKRLCTALGYGIYFGFIAAFAWLNVMCLDIWWTFGSMRTVQPMRKAGAERRRFLWYSLYAWTIAVLLTLTMFLLDQYPVATWLDSGIGKDMCWFGSIQNSRTDWPHYIFFVVPMGLGTCTNFVLFMMTARHCARVKSEVHRLQAGSIGDRAKKRFRVDRAKYVLTGKLWVVMGAGWLSELASTLTAHPEWLWSILDLFNELQGVFIFAILIFKPKLYYLIRKRLGLEKPDAQKAGSSSARTSSTFLSRTISSDERATMRISHGNNIKLP